MTATRQRAPAARTERESARAPAVAPDDARRAGAAARRFLHGYLRYSYGRAGAGGLAVATARLVRELATAPVRVPARLVRARPRLISIWAQAAIGERAIIVVATVDDGQRRYDVPLTVRAQRRRWLVAAVGG